MQENEAIRKALSIWATGGQFGDEGKGNVIGKLINLMLKRLRAHMVYELFDNNKKPILVLRYQGGSNAGHKVTVGTMVYALHQIPSGIVFPHTYNMIGKGVYLNPRATLKEITNPNDPKKPGLRELGVKVTPDNLGIAANAIVTLDWYVAADQADFNKADHTSTGRGIKETGADKYGRIGIRFIEFLDPVLFKDILVKKQMKKEISSDINIDTLVSSYAMEREMLKDFMTLEHEALKNHGTYFKLWEGAQGFGLDVDDGPYPGTTSSNPAKSPYKSDLALLIFKLYTSNVGIGDRAFVTRFEDRELEREFGASSDEFGTTTGKPRPLGWFDAVLAKYAVDVINPDYLVGTCGDRMTAFSRLGVRPKIAVAYKIDGKRYDKWDESFMRRDTLYKVIPVYEEFDSWKVFANENGILSDPAKRYVDRIQQLTGKEFGILNRGPALEEFMLFKNILGNL